MEIHVFHLTDEQKKKLLNGHSVQLKPDHLHGNSKVVLDKKQTTKVHKAKREGKGVRLRFHSDELIHNNVIHGSGFRSLLSKAKQALYAGAKHVHNHLQETGVYDQITTAGKKLLKEKAHVALGHANEYVHKSIDNSRYVPSQMKDTLHSAADSQVHHAANMIDSQLGGGFGKSERFFRDAGRAIVGAAKSKVGKQILQGVAKVAVPALLTGISAETGLPVGALAPQITGAVNNGINGMGIHEVTGRKVIRKRATGRKVIRKRGGALYPSGY
jgi:hypothetical protein